MSLSNLPPRLIYLTQSISGHNDAYFSLATGCIQRQIVVKQRKERKKIQDGIKRYIDLGSLFALKCALFFRDFQIQYTGGFMLWYIYKDIKNQVQVRSSQKGNIPSGKSRSKLNHRLKDSSKLHLCVPFSELRI